MKNLEVIGNQLIEVIAYGDALGLSVEARKREEILRDLGQVTIIQELSGHRDFRGEPGGVWSDDTQLSMAVAESLTRKKEFDLEDQAAKLLDYAHETPFIERDGVLKPRGWGNSTYNSVKRLEQGYSPEVSGEVNGAGNGVLMRLAPLSLWQQIRHTEEPSRSMEVTALTRMTHDAPEAVVASLVHNDVLSALLKAVPDRREETRYELARYAHKRANHYEDVFDADKKVVSKHLGRLFADSELTPEKIVNMAPNGGFYAPETLLMVYGSFILESTFPASVQRTVELGGDTDTTSAIIAPMSLFEAGFIEPYSDMDRLQELGRLRRVSRVFTATALKGAKS